MLALRSTVSRWNDRGVHSGGGRARAAASAVVRCCVNTDVALETATNACGDISVDSSRLDRTPRKLLDVSRLAKLGWRATISLHDGLKCAYAAYQAGAPVAARE